MASSVRAIIAMIRKWRTNSIIISFSEQPLCHKRKGRRFLFLDKALPGSRGKYFMRERKYCLHLLNKIEGSEVVPGNIMGSSGSSILFKLKDRDEVKTLPG
jgi:hypothetical protein